MIRVGTRSFDLESIEEIKLSPSDYEDRQGTDYGEYPSDELEISPEGLLLIDPVYLADVANDFADPDVRYLWEHGILLGNEGFGPIARVGHDILFLCELVDDAEEAEVLSPGIGGDSATILLLPLAPDIPDSLKVSIRENVGTEDGTIIRPEPGKYRVGVIRGSSAEDEFENIVLQHL